MTPRQTTPLSEALAAGRWMSATAETRNALIGTKFDVGCIGELDAMWSELTNGRFGFSAQIRAVGRPPPFAGTPEQDWSYAILVGKSIGWHVGRHWRRWRGVGPPSFPGEVIAPEGPSEAFPAGCFPFHDAVIPVSDIDVDASWQMGFSPRDCWGEYPWTDWCNVWRAVSEAPAR